MPEKRVDLAALLPHVGVFGGVRRFLEIGNELVQRGHTFTLYHPEGTPPAWLPFRGEVRALPILEDRSHDVVMTAEPLLCNAFERARAKLKLFYCVHKNLPERSIATHDGWTLLANSSGLQRRLWRRYRVRAEAAVGGINLEMFRPATAPRATTDALRVLVYGRLSRGGKGTTTAIRAVERVANARPVQLVLFDHLGVGNERDPRADVDVSIPHEFHLNLSQDDLARLYGSCDVFLSAERRAGWNNTVAEAMACGVPVVCTRAGTEDLVVRGETAWLVHWRHPWFFARALAHLARNRPARQRLRDAALQRVRLFTWERVAERIEHIALKRLG